MQLNSSTQNTSSTLSLSHTIDLQTKEEKIKGVFFCFFLKTQLSTPAWSPCIFRKWEALCHLCWAYQHRYNWKRMFHECDPLSPNIYPHTQSFGVITLDIQGHLVGNWRRLLSVMRNRRWKSFSEKLLEHTNVIVFPRFTGVGAGSSFIVWFQQSAS